MPENKKEQVLSVRDLDITFKTTAGKVHAIRGVNIDLYKGETVALVGESGSGKSVTMKAAMGILAQNAIVNSGSIQFSYHHADGSPETVDLLQKDKKNSFVILYCINRMCTVSFEAALEAINAGYENVYVMPDGIQGWVSNGYPFEGTSWKPYESKAPVLLQRKD